MIQVNSLVMIAIINFSLINRFINEKCYKIKITDICIIQACKSTIILKLNFHMEQGVAMHKRNKVPRVTLSMLHHENMPSAIALGQVKLLYGYKIFKQQHLNVFLNIHCSLAKSGPLTRQYNMKYTVSKNQDKMVIDLLVCLILLIW